MNAWTEEELEIYEYWQIRDAGDRYKIQEEFEKGIEKGRGEERLENACAMKKLGIDVEIIMQVTGLNREEVEKL